MSVRRVARIMEQLGMVGLFGGTAAIWCVDGRTELSVAGLCITLMVLGYVLSSRVFAIDRTAPKHWARVVGGVFLCLASFAYTLLAPSLSYIEPSHRIWLGVALSAAASTVVLSKRTFAKIAQAGAPLSTSDKHHGQGKE